MSARGTVVNARDAMTDPSLLRQDDLRDVLEVVQVDDAVDWWARVQQSCDKPFENPAFFQRDGKPFCERCFSIMIRNEI